MKVINIENYNLDQKDLLRFGFTWQDGILVFSKNIMNNEFRVEFKIMKSELKIEVYDNDFDEIYTLFSVESASGEVVASIRDEVDNILKELLAISQQDEKIYNELLNYIYEKYQSAKVNPFTKHPDIYALVTQKNKWYALFLDVEYNKLKKDSLLKDRVKIVNLKHYPNSLLEIIDDKNIFPSYHMNKKHWISVVLDENIDFEYLKDLVDESYNLVSKK